MNRGMKGTFVERTSNLLVCPFGGRESRGILAKVPTKATYNKGGVVQTLLSKEGRMDGGQAEPKSVPTPGSRDMAGRLEKVVSLVVAGEHLLVQLACPYLLMSGRKTVDRNSTALLPTFKAGVKPRK